MAAYQRLAERSAGFEELARGAATGTGAYVDMSCSPQGHPRTMTIESRISEISLLNPSEEEILLRIDGSMEVTEQESTTRSVDIPLPPLARSESSSSLPSGFIRTEDTGFEDSRDRQSFKKPLEPTAPSSPFSSLSMRNSASSGCLESKSPDLSPVTLSFPRILRNSFSKLLTKATSISSGRSKSPESGKSLADDDSSHFSMGEERKWSQSDENIEEIVSDSVQKGLPIIPFAYPTFTVVNKKLEETKDMIRKNSAKDLKRVFNENRYLDIYPEEEEESREDKSLNSVVSCARRELASTSCSPTSYVEMSLGHSTASGGQVAPTTGDTDEEYMNMARVRLVAPSRSLSVSEDPYMRMSEDPYMRMSESVPRKMSEDSYMPMSIRTLPKKSRRESEDQMFQLDVSPGKSPCHQPSQAAYTEKTFPRRKKKINIFNRTHEDGERNNQILNGSLMKPFKKGNKHRDDYVYVDLEKQNYMNMSQSGSNKWKFLNFSSSTK
jgi:hypothetical protein